MLCAVSCVVVCCVLWLCFVAVRCGCVLWLCVVVVCVVCCVVSWLCGRVFVSCCGVWCDTLKNPRVWTPKRLRVCIQNISVCAGKTPTCSNHVVVVPAHTEAFWSLHTGVWDREEGEGGRERRRRRRRRRRRKKNRVLTCTRSEYFVRFERAWSTSVSPDAALLKLASPSSGC